MDRRIQVGSKISAWTILDAPSAGSIKVQCECGNIRTLTEASLIGFKNRQRCNECAKKRFVRRYGNAVSWRKPKAAVPAPGKASK